MVVDSNEELRKIYENSPFNNLLGIKLAEFEEGKVVYSLETRPSHLNVNQAIHGGVYFTLLDSVMGATIRSVVKLPIVTINTSINYFTPVANGETMLAKANIIQEGGSIVTAEGTIEDENGNVFAKATGTFKKIRNT